jgi:hypothetical protein
MSFLIVNKKEMGKNDECKYGIAHHICQNKCGIILDSVEE